MRVDKCKKTCALLTYKCKPESKVLRRSLKIKNKVHPKSKIHYGSHLDDTPDVSYEKLNRLCKRYLEEKHVNKNIEHDHKS